MRTNINITFNNKTQCLAAWAQELGIPEGTIYARHRNGLETESILFAGNLNKRDI